MATTFSATADDTQLWNRLIDPDRPDIPPEAAQYFLTLEFAADDRQRMHELVEKTSTSGGWCWRRWRI